MRKSLRVGDVLSCRGDPGRDHEGRATLFCTAVLGVEKAEQEGEQSAGEVQMLPGGLALLPKPAGVVSASSARARSYDSCTPGSNSPPFPAPVAILGCTIFGCTILIAPVHEECEDVFSSHSSSHSGPL